jgi:hypothetical protein
MGQYYKMVNLDKKEYINPHSFGDGAKLLEFSGNGGMMAGLAILLASGNGRGGGDLRAKHNVEYIGRWAGDRIVCVGDYDDADKWVPGDLYSERGDNSEWKNVSFEVMRCLCDDEWFEERLAKSLGWRSAKDIPEWLLPAWAAAQKSS